MTIVIPIAKSPYDRKDEQQFRDLARRNLELATATAQSITEKWQFANIPVYADNTAAGVGGLTQGQFYRTATGQLMVKL